LESIWLKLKELEDHEPKWKRHWYLRTQLNQSGV
jgi:hypothetical protein